MADEGQKKKIVAKNLSKGKDDNVDQLCEDFPSLF